MSPDKQDFAASEAKRKEMLKGTSLALLNTFCEVADTFCLIVDGTLGVEDDLMSAVDTASKTLWAFADSQPSFNASTPRIPRDEDKVKFLPGQHRGFTLQFINTSGDVGQINVYGGLRILDTSDYQDTDVAMKKTHTGRTEQVVFQPTHINIHLRGISGNIYLDMWFVFSPGVKIRLDKLYLDNAWHDIHPEIVNKYSQFGPLSHQLHESLSILTQLIPSA